MDPNEALAKMRAAITRYNEGLANDSGDWISNAQEAVEMAEALDEWLSKDGFLPSDWEADDHIMSNRILSEVGQWTDEEFELALGFSRDDDVED